ncbi:hypothetical protein NHP21005_07490 [Helicobacter sp. NHP21005]|nr:hypothetical protein NHP21005_07490 [Helicobacter sp. NHP21005]
MAAGVLKRTLRGRLKGAADGGVYLHPSCLLGGVRNSKIKSIKFYKFFIGLFLPQKPEILLKQTPPLVGTKLTLATPKGTPCEKPNTLKTAFLRDAGLFQIWLWPLKGAGGSFMPCCECYGL